MLRLLFALAACVACAAANYCSVCSDHTMCKFPTTRAGRACTNFKATALTNSDKTAILNAHNSLRNKVALGKETINSQPSASNMRKMVWSDELATIAQRWANQCQFQHDSCRKSSDGTYNGQNLYWEASSRALTAPNWAKAIQNWYDEVKDRRGSLNVQPFRSTSGPVVGHYTQLVWATSSKVGCGYADYDEDGWKARLVVCNYGPGGNIIGQPMYQSGTAASKCPSGTRRDATYTGLCA